MNNIPQISDAELEVMKVVWAKGRITAAEIIRDLEGKRAWKAKTIGTLISRLTAKGALTADKSDPKLYVYEAAIGEPDYLKHANTSFLQRMYDGSVGLMLSAFVREHKLSRQDIEELHRILDGEIECE